MRWRGSCLVYRRQAVCQPSYLPSSFAGDSAVTFNANLAEVLPGGLAEVLPGGESSTAAAFAQVGPHRGHIDLPSFTWKNKCIKEKESQWFLQHWNYSQWIILFGFMSSLILFFEVSRLALNSRASSSTFQGWNQRRVRGGLSALCTAGNTLPTELNPWPMNGFIALVCLLPNLFIKSF